MQDFKLWYRSQTRAEKEAFAARANTTTKYIEKQLVFGKRVPRPDLMRRLADASLGRIGYEDLVMYFYGEKAA